MFKVVLLVLAFIGASLALIKPCTRNGNLTPAPIEIRITGCANDEICRIVRGTEISGEMDFFSSTQATSLRPEITAHALGTTVIYELPVDRRNGCNWLVGTVCPLSPGEFATYDLRMPITDEYPFIPLDIYVRLFDQNNVVKFCTVIGSEVVPN